MPATPSYPVHFPAARSRHYRTRAFPCDFPCVFLRPAHLFISGHLVYTAPFAMLTPPVLPAAPVSCTPCKIPCLPGTPLKTPNSRSPRPHIPPLSSFHIRLSRISRLRSYFHIGSSRIHGSVRHAHSAGTARHASISRPSPPPGTPLRPRRISTQISPTDTIPDFSQNRSP